MTKEEAIEQLAYAFPKLYYFVQPHKTQAFEIKDRIGILKKEAYLTKNEIELNSHCYSTLWLIETLIATRGSYCKTAKKQCCKRSDIEDIFLWRYSEKNSEFERIMDILESVALIEQHIGAEDRRENVIVLTDDGVTLLNDLREERKQTLNDILNFIALETGTRYMEFLTGFLDAADKAWNIISGQTQQN